MRVRLPQTATHLLTGHTQPKGVSGAEGDVLDSWCRFDQVTLNPRTPENIPGKAHRAPCTPSKPVQPRPLRLQLLLRCCDDAGKGAPALPGPVSLRHGTTALPPGSTRPAAGPAATTFEDRTEMPSCVAPGWEARVSGETQNRPNHHLWGSYHALGTGQSVFHICEVLLTLCTVKENLQMQKEAQRE